MGGIIFICDRKKVLGSAVLTPFHGHPRRLIVSATRYYFTPYNSCSSFAQIGICLAIDNFSTKNKRKKETEIMDNRFMWLEGSKAGRRGRTASKRSGSSKSGQSKSRKSRKDEIKSRDFFGFLASMLKLRIFHLSERYRYDAYRYN